MRRCVLHIIVACWLCVIVNAPSNATPLPQEIYVWQRAWRPAVRDSVKLHGDAFSEMVLLAGEISWKNARPALTRVWLPYDLIRQTHVPVGLALRIDFHAGPISSQDATALAIAEIAGAIVDETRTNGVALRELQIDFDSAESQLGGYAQWIRAIRRHVGSVPVTITALPSWLNSPAFPALAAAAGGYVLQVHSLQRPESYDSIFSLCDPGAARAAVSKAGEIGIPFWVALPTYGYVLAFATDGKFVGLSAEGPPKSWPATARLRTVGADAMQLAGRFNTGASLDLPPKTSTSPNKSRLIGPLEFPLFLEFPRAMLTCIALCPMTSEFPKVKTAIALPPWCHSATLSNCWLKSLSSSSCFLTTLRGLPSGDVVIAFGQPACKARNAVSA